MKMARLNALAPLLLLVAVIALLGLFIPDFLNPRNMRGLVLSVTLVGTIASTMMLALALREVDLSVGSITALAGVLAAVVIGHTGSVVAGILGGLAAGAAV